MTTLTWPIETRKLTDLKPWDRNPRKISESKYRELIGRIKKRGFHDVLKIDIDGTVLSGNQRLRALIEMGYTEIECRVAPHALSEKEREVIALESNHNDGVDDWDELANFDLEVLKEGGFSDDELKFNLQISDGVFPDAEKETIVPCKRVSIDIPPRVWLLQNEEIMKRLNEVAADYGLVVECKT